jgi:hypothetical protein
MTFFRRVGKDPSDALSYALAPSADQSQKKILGRVLPHGLPHSCPLWAFW